MVAINTIRYDQLSPKYFMLHLNRLPDQVVEIGSDDDLEVIFVTSISFEIEGLWLMT